ncbi:hypothetical protein SmJEL517_g04064 [Synchytrium microbalum]|uniref:BCAS3 domain-containing protein n=1 Tax=Synchytrium microbalum TaxID=1806994 RepID=A0A507C0L3_9FUNG|nr:uncharacterized protein SmJEL517_g04064 [Synchytrium microbalum]TPX32908.1 hypothetical protein SmJEL517_g04064 [Synchytrium microbalum]
MDNKKRIITASFNQDATCFSIGTIAGFRIFSTDTAKPISKRETLTINENNEDGAHLPDDSKGTTAPAAATSRSQRFMGGIAIVEMLQKSNYMALVGGGKQPAFPANRVMIWDDAKEKMVIEMEFLSQVKAVKLRRDRIIVALLNKVFVYTFSAKPQRLYTFETVDNDLGLLAVTPSPFSPPLSSTSNTSKIPYTALLAFPGRTKGQIQLVDLRVSSSSAISATPSSTNITSSLQPSVSIIAAHNTPLAALSVSNQGHLLASASETGTLIRIYETKSGRLLNELRRGADRADIYCIAFNPSATRVVVASDKTTIHIFNLTASNGRGGSGGSMSMAQAGPSRPISRPPQQQYSRITPQTSDRPALPARTPSVYSDRPHTSSASSSSHNATGTSSSSSTATASAYSALSSLTSSLKPGNRSSPLSFLSPYIPMVGTYLSSEWSFAQFTLPYECKTIVAFVPRSGNNNGNHSSSNSNTNYSTGGGYPTTTPSSSSAVATAAIDEYTSLVALCNDGSLYRFTFDPILGGECVREKYQRFFRGVSAELPDEEWEEDMG